MTVAVSTRKNKHVGNNTTDTYAYSFRIDDEAELVVQEIVRATNVVSTLTLNSDYTVTGVASDSGGTVVLTAGNLASANDLLIYAATDIEQVTSIRNQSTFYGRIHEAFFDRITRIVQELNTKLTRSIKLEAHISGISGDIEGTPTADYYIGLNGSADGFEYKAPPTNGSNGADGADGSVWTSGAGAPAGGADGDFYLRTSNGDVYSKLAGVWSVVDNLTGPTGATGASGADGAIVRTITGTYASPTSIVAATGIVAPADNADQVKYLKGPAAGAAVTANPQIAGGLVNGQEMDVIGCDDTDWFSLSHGNGLIMDGTVKFVAGTVVKFKWNGADWIMVGGNHLWAAG